MSGPCLRRKMLEHVLNFLIKLLGVLVGVARQVLVSSAPPNQLFGVALEDIHDERSNLVTVERGCRFSHSAPAPTTKSVVVGVVLLLDRRLFNGCQLQIATTWYLGVTSGR